MWQQKILQQRDATTTGYACHSVLLPVCVCVFVSGIVIIERQFHTSVRVYVLAVLVGSIMFAILLQWCLLCFVASLIVLQPNRSTIDHGE